VIRAGDSQEKVMAEVMSARELAALLGLTENTVYKKVRRGEIPAVRIGRSIRFPRKQMEDWLQSQTRAEIKPTGIANNDGHFTVATCGGLRTALSRSAYYHARAS
jgi:excisionase family DNA binding protein